MAIPPGKVNTQADAGPHETNRNSRNSSDFVPDKRHRSRSGRKVLPVSVPPTLRRRRIKSRPTVSALSTSSALYPHCTTHGSIPICSLCRTDAFSAFLLPIQLRLRKFHNFRKSTRVIASGKDCRHDYRHTHPHRYAQYPHENAHTHVSILRSFNGLSVSVRSKFLMALNLAPSTM